MKKIIIKTKKISIPFLLAGVFAMFLFPRVNVDAEIPNTEAPVAYDSLHQYSALENTQSFSGLAQNNSDVSGSTNINDPQEQNTNTDPSVNIPAALQVITEKEHASLFAIESAMASLENASEVKTFLIGNSLGILKYQSVQIRDEAIALQTLTGLGPDINTRIQIDREVKLLKEEETKVEKFILEQENKFSLFGWFTKLL